MYFQREITNMSSILLARPTKEIFQSEINNFLNRCKLLGKKL